MSANICRLNISLRTPEDIIPHLGKGALHWKAGRSAHALCNTWFAANGIPPVVNAALSTKPELQNLELIDGFFERSVELGDGLRPSQTDLLAVCASKNELIVMTVEGKVDEPFGPRVSDWLDGSSNKIARLDILCNRLKISAKSVSSIRYQLIHRFASAIIEAKRYRSKIAIVVIHSFCNKLTGLIDFTAFLSVIGSKKYSINETDGPFVFDGVDLYALWVSDSPPVAS